ncbi:hypothetical protein [Pseudomonas sp. PIC25]|uniref:hypothetical protein n=1 Tax=Pseudomonas sp. PIC25 TaxID=1958773 RepID=UPI0021140507|nr:hypothetical protein [Pseudomonas sp. PIC25]
MTRPSPPADAALPVWSVVRLDDNGNRFLVSTGHTYTDAQAIADDFQARATSNCTK